MSEIVSCFGSKSTNTHICIHRDDEIPRYSPLAGKFTCVDLKALVSLNVNGH